MTDSQGETHDAADAQYPTSATIAVENVGGIDGSEVAFSSGATVLTGRNATNRTSFLQAVMGALGSDRISLKADADEGSVTLDLGDETYTRTLRREGGTVVRGGDPYLSDATDADLFAFLLEDNEARQAVERGDDLRDVIMRPVDTEEIRDEIRRLEAEKRDLDDRLDELSSLEDRLPELESRRVQRGAREPMVSAREARKAVDVVLAAYESADRGESVPVDSVRNGC